MSPVVFEAILYSKINERFWDINDITVVDHEHQRVNSRANIEADGGSSEDEEQQILNNENFNLYFDILYTTIYIVKIFYIL